MYDDPLADKDESIDADLDPGRRIIIIPESNRDYLDNKQVVDYYEYRRRFLEWLLHFGKNPAKAEGYSPHTVYSTGYRAARFDLWRWRQDGEYSVPPRPDDADEFMKKVAYGDLKKVTKGKQEEMVKRYFKWLGHEYDADPWEPDYTFQGEGEQSPRDYLTRQERRKVRTAALKVGNIPSYNNMSADKRKEWKRYIARVLDKPADGVKPEDWEEVEGWKETSIVWSSLDAGFRPVEVGRAKTSWVDTENKVLRIPKEESSKNEGNWVVSITDRTATALSHWLEERELYDRYEDTEALWLTSHGNPYGSKTLNRLLRKVCEVAGIPTENRSMTWYSIRHSVGTYMTNERDLAATKAQLRHKSAKTTMKYDQVPVEDRREALDNMD